MTTITIEVPEGKVAKQVTNLDGSITISYVDKEPIRSKSWEEFCKNHPIIDNEWYFDNMKTWAILGLHQLERTKQKSLLETKEDAEGILVLIQLTRLHDEWIGDYKYTDNSWAIWKSDFEKYTVSRFSYYRLLYFPTKEMAEEFLKCFKDLIITAKKFI